MNTLLKHTLLYLILIFSVSYADATEIDGLKLYKVQYVEQSLADKILISFHHAILEVNAREQYLIANLSESELDLLSRENVVIKPAEQWQTKLKKILSKQKNHAKSQLNSIPEYQCYSSVEETYQDAENLVQLNATLATWLDIGDSWMKTNNLDGYDLMVLKITNTEINQEKPILFIHSSMHAREYAPAELNLDFAKWLLHEYNRNAEAKWLVDHREIHLLFHMNPDGRKVAENQILQRKNMNQNHCADSMFEADIGVDLNRNFAHTWGISSLGSSADDCEATFRGITAESEPETQAVSTYIRSLFSDERGELDSDAAPKDKSGLHIDLHSYGELVLWPYGHKNQTSPNNNGFVQLGRKLASFNGYTPKQSIGLYMTDGTSSDVSYGELGVAALTFELGNSFFQDCSTYKTEIKPDNLQALRYAAKVSRAPYLIPFGIDITSLTANQSLTEATVVKGDSVNVEVTAESEQVSNFEYVINGSFDDTEAIQVVESNISNNDSGGAQTSFILDTSMMDEGKHTLTVRTQNEQLLYGSPSSVFINISNQSAPLPSFTFTCQNFTCNFDASLSVDNDGDIVSFHWIAFQGASEVVVGEGELINYTFDLSGEITIQLTVEDNDGLTTVSSRQVTLSENNDANDLSTQTNSSGGGGFVNLFFLIFLRCFIHHHSKAY